MMEPILFGQEKWLENYGALFGSAGFDQQTWPSSSGQTVLTYSFVNQFSEYANQIEDFNISESSFRSFPEHLRVISREVFTYVETVTNIKFVEDNASPLASVDLVLWGTAFAGGLATSPPQGDIAIGIANSPEDGYAASGSDVIGDGSYAGFVQTLLHELGHALGLTHPRDYSDIENPSSAGYAIAIDPQLDSQRYTVLSYLDYDGRSYDWVQSYMALDILALQYLYGVNTLSTGKNDAYTKVLRC